MGKKILTEAGYEVIAVSNGAAAMKKLAEKPEIIILDVNMPGYTGLEVCEKVRSNPEMEKTPVLLAVGKMEHFDPKDGQKVRADGVLIKPFEASDLLAAVGKLAERVKAAQKPVYEKTMIFRAPQVEEFDKDDTYTGWKAEAPAHSDEHEESREPAALEVPQEMASAPAMAEFYTDATPEPSPTQAAQETVVIPAPEQTVRIPAPEMSPAAFIEHQLVDLPPIPMEAMPASTPAVADDTVKIPAPVGIPGFDDAPIAEAVPEGLSSTEHASIQALLEPEAAAAPAMELEPTSAPGSEFQVQPDPAFESRGGDDTGIAIPAQDPGLVTDAQELTNQFPTKFGVENAEPQAVGYVGDLPEEQAAALRAPVEVESAAASSGAVDDDFEARVAAAMAGFEMDEPAAELEPAPVEEMAAPEPVIEAGAPGAASMDELPMAASDPLLDSSAADPLLDTSGGYQPAVMAQETPAAEIELAPAPEPEPEIIAEAVVEAESEPEPVAVMATQADEVVPSAAPEMAMAAAASAAASAPAPIIPEPQDPRAVPEGMVDAELVEQLQAAVAVMPPAPVVHEEIAPVMKPEPAATVNIVDPEIADKGAVDPQLASALAKAVGAEAPAVTSYVSAAGLDPAVVSDAVSTVLHRMLPEIVVEVIREVEAARRK